MVYASWFMLAFLSRSLPAFLLVFLPAVVVPTCACFCRCCARQCPCRYRVMPSFFCRCYFLYLCMLSLCLPLCLYWSMLSSCLPPWILVFVLPLVSILSCILVLLSAVDVRIYLPSFSGAYGYCAYPTAFRFCCPPWLSCIASPMFRLNDDVKE